AERLVPHGNALPDPTGALERIGQRRELSPVDEHRGDGAGLGDAAGFAEPRRAPAEPRALVERVTHEIGANELRTRVHVLAARRLRGVAHARVGRVGDERAHAFARHLAEYLQRIAVFDVPVRETFDYLFDQPAVHS